MKLRQIAFALALVFLTAVPSFAQGIEVGVGVAMPVTNTDLATGAQVDSFGVVRVNSRLDSSPQLFVEMHKPFKLGPKFAVGPMLGFTPKLDLGMASNNESVQPVAAGIGIILQIPSKLKQHINVGVVFMRTAPIVQLADGYADGFQAPRGANGAPLGIQFQEKSLSRVMLTMSVSGWFK